MLRFLTLTCALLLTQSVKLKSPKEVPAPAPKEFVLSPKDIMSSVIMNMPELKGAEIVFENVRATVIKPDGRQEVVYLNGKQDM